MSKDILSQLKDIKPNVQIIDYWFYLFCTVGIILLLLIMYFVYKKLAKRKTDPYLERLKNLDYKKSKKTAYEFSEYAKHFITDENRSLYEEIVKELEQYKYRPKVDDLKPEIIEKMKKYIGEIQ